eukprot:g17572.t1
MTGADPKKQVICVETGEVYSSAVKAAKAVGSSYNSMKLAIKKKSMLEGFTWQYLEVSDPAPIAGEDGSEV